MGILDTPAYSRAQADARYRKASRPRVAFLGDSITANPNSDGDTTTGNIKHANSAPTFAMFMSGGAWELVANAGVPGQTSTQILARIQSDVIAKGADICVIFSTYMNDVFQGFTVAQTMNNIDAMVKQLRTANVTPVLCTPTPDGRTMGTSGRNVQLYQLRRKVIDYAARNALVCVDLMTPIVDPAGGVLQTIYTDGGGSVHPGAAGYQVLAQSVVDALKSLIPPIAPPLITDRGTGNPDVIFGRGLMLETAVAGVPGGWTYSGTSATLSIATDTAVLGNMARITSTDVAATATLSTNFPAAGTTWNVGDVLEFTGIFSADAASRPRIQVFATGAASSEQSLDIIYNTKVAVTRGYFGKRWKVPAGTTAISLGLKMTAGPGIVDFARVGVANLTALGIA